MNIIITPKIKNIEIRDEGIIKKASIRFKDGLNIIVGKNASGKTTAIKAIEKSFDRNNSNILVKKSPGKLITKEIDEKPTNNPCLSIGEILINIYNEIISSTKNGCIIIDDPLSKFADINLILTAISKSNNQVVFTNPNDPQFINRLQSHCKFRDVKLNIIDTKSFELKT